MFSKFTKCKFIGDILLICLAISPVIYLEKYGAPRNGGFYCNDDALKHTFNGETYPLWSLLVIALVVPIFLIVFIELMTFGAIYKTLVSYLFGLFSSTSLIEILKFMVGRPRPVFLDLCKPVLPDGTTCNDSQNLHKFIVEFSCASTNHKTFQKALSFPSGHASIAFYAMIFIAIYLHFRVSSKYSMLLKHVLQFICVSLAASIAVSRITDHVHFCTDVAVGSLIGILFAIWTAFTITSLTRKKEYKNLPSGSGSEV